MERLLLILEHFKKTPSKLALDIFIAQNNSNNLPLEVYSFKIADMLRKNGFNVVQDFSNSSLKSQLKKANNLNVSVTLLIGENELTNKEVTVKFMKKHTQEIVSFDQLVGILIKYFSGSY